MPIIPWTVSTLNLSRILQSLISTQSCFYCTLHTEPCWSEGWRQRGGNLCGADWTTPGDTEQRIYQMCVNLKEIKCFMSPRIPTFAGILAASTERQFTHEAITSTGGLMTDVNLTDGKHKETNSISYQIGSTQSCFLRRYASEFTSAAACRCVR